MRATIIVPTIREDSIKKFLKEWKPYLSGHDLIVIEDNPKRTFNIDVDEHLSWEEIDEDMGEDSWIIPRRSDAIRNYGFLLAAQSKDRQDMIVTMDDDCYPLSDSITDHWKALESTSIAEPWFDTMYAYPVYPRGFPRLYKETQTVLNHGLWNNIPDLDGETQLKHPNVRTSFSGDNFQIPTGVFFPLCGMNIAFRPEVIPAMYFMPMGRGQKYHRFADIWTGVIAKKVFDHLQLGVRSGGCEISHSRASNAEKNVKLEELGLPENEKLWDIISEIKLHQTTLEEAYLELMGNLAAFLGGYWERTYLAAQLWTDYTR